MNYWGESYSAPTAPEAALPKIVIKHDITKCGGCDECMRKIAYQFATSDCVHTRRLGRDYLKSKRFQERVGKFLFWVCVGMLLSMAVARILFEYGLPGGL